MIETIQSPDFFYLVEQHYNYISTIDRQKGDRYKFRPISIVKMNEGYEYSFEIEDKDKVNEVFQPEI